MADVQKYYPDALSCDQEVCYNECDDTSVCTIRWNIEGETNAREMTCEEFADEHFTDCEEKLLTT